MLHTIEISNEVLDVNVKRDLGPLIEEHLTKIRDKLDNQQRIDINDFRSLSDDVSKILNMNIEFTHLDDQGIMGGAFTSFTVGHTGSKFDNINRVTLATEQGVNTFINIDLTNLKVTGEAVATFKYKIGLSIGLLSAINRVSIAEATAITLHEIGHCWETLATMGDYVYLNYALTEGILILQGRKANKYKIQLLDETWLKKNVDPADYEKFVNDRTEGNIRKVILSSFKKAQRPHLTGDVQSRKRDEQLADLFATRLGYGRPLATALTKSGRYYNDREYRSVSSHITAEVFKGLFMIIGLPVTLGIIAGNLHAGYDPISSRYDNQRQRLMKIKQDLVAQLKWVKDSTLKPGIDDDIKVIDSLINDLANEWTIFDKILDFLSPQRRNDKRATELEDTLESLLNNDLFVRAYRLTK